MDYQTEQEEQGLLLPGWSDAYSGPPSVVMDPEPLPPLSIPWCERVTVLVQAGQEGPKPMPVLYSPVTGKRYLFTKKLVQEKVRVLIMLARELYPVSSTPSAHSPTTPPATAQPSCPTPSCGSTTPQHSAPCRCASCCAAAASTTGSSCTPSTHPACSPPAATAPSCAAACTCPIKPAASPCCAGESVWAPGEAVVIKVTDKNYLNQGGELIENPLDEVAAMKLLSGPGQENILGLLDYMQDREYLYVVMPYLPGKDLFHKMKSRTKGLSQQRTRRIMREVVDGLLYMKKHRIAHRDLSLENVMFDSKGVSKIIDFGMCVRLPQDVTGCSRVLLSAQKKRGKASYVCPEVVREDVSDPFAADVWSLGVILFIMLTLTPLYQSPEDVAFRMLCNGQFDELLDHYATLGVGVSPCARSLIKGMLCPDPETRLTLEEVLSHPWMLANDDIRLPFHAPHTHAPHTQHAHPPQQYRHPHAHLRIDASKTACIPPIVVPTSPMYDLSPTYGAPGVSPRHHQEQIHSRADGGMVDLYSYN